MRIARLTKLRFFLVCLGSALLVGFALLVFSVLIDARAWVAALLTGFGIVVTAMLFLRSRSRVLTLPAYTSPEISRPEPPHLPSDTTNNTAVTGPPPLSRSTAHDFIASDRPLHIPEARRYRVSLRTLGALVGLIVITAALYVLPDMRPGPFISERHTRIVLGKKVEQWAELIAGHYYSFARLTKKQFTRQRTGEPTYDEAISDLYSDENMEIRQYASLLIRDRCNKPAAHSLILQLNTDLRFLETRTVGSTFLDKCVKDYDIAFPTVYALFHSSKFDMALNLLDQYAAQERDSSQFASWRGFILEKLGRIDEAAYQFERALFLFPDIKKVDAGQFYYLTQALRAVEKFCDAARPLELYVSFDPGERSTTQIESSIAELRRMGKCQIEEKAEGVAVRLRPSGGIYLIDAEINGAKGVFVFDTGASTIHLTNAFSTRAGLLLRGDNMVMTQGVTGVRKDYLTKAETVSVGGILARDVIVTVASDSSTLGPGIDGLLGQTFLSRVKVSFNPATRTLTMGPRR